MEEATKREGWEAAARRTQFSERVELKELPGFWIRARKYPIRGEDEIKSIQAKIKASVPKETKAFLRTVKESGKTIEKYLKGLSQSEALTIIDELPSQNNAIGDLMAASLRWGIGEHNLSGETTGTIDQTLIDEIMGYPVVSREIYEIIREWNSPLA
jgi:hypothetical protein